jgi:hypothetical protein
MLKSSKYVLVVKLQEEKGGMIIAHNIENREIMFNDIDKEIGEGYELKDLLLPTDLVILQSKKEYAVMVIYELALNKVQMIDNAEGEYGFGANEITSKVYMCHSTQNGYKIYEAQPRKAFRLIYSSETELNRRFYGEPEIVN